MLLNSAFYMFEDHEHNLLRIAQLLLCSEARVHHVHQEDSTSKRHTHTYTHRYINPAAPFPFHSLSFLSSALWTARAARLRVLAGNLSDFDRAETFFLSTLWRAAAYRHRAKRRASELGLWHHWERGEASLHDLVTHTHTAHNLRRIQCKWYRHTQKCKARANVHICM